MAKKKSGSGKAKPAKAASKAVTAAADPPAIEARQLRRIAETVFGYWGESLCLAYDAPGHASRKDAWTIIKDSETGGNPRVPISGPPANSTITELPPAWGTLKVTIQRKLNGAMVGEPEPLPDRFDALFWTPSAMEKFVLDYYRPLKEFRDWSLLHDRVVNGTQDRFTIFAIAHTYPTVDERITVDPVKFLTPTGWENGEVFLANLVRFHSR